MIPWLALFWTVSSVVGAILTARNTRVAWLAWRTLHRGETEPGVRVMTWSHVRTGLILLWMHATFLTVGILGLIRPAADLPRDWQGWFATVVVMSIPLLLIVISVTAEQDRWRIAALEHAGG